MALPAMLDTRGALISMRCGSVVYRVRVGAILAEVYSTRMLLVDNFHRINSSSDLHMAEME